MCDIAKAKGEAGTVKAIRGILAADEVGKALHSEVVKAATPHTDSYLLDTQYGARIGGGCDLPHHLGTTAYEYAKTLGHSAAGIYCDLSDAFHRVVRELVLHTPSSDEELAHIARSVGITPEDFTAYRDLASHDTLLEEAEVPKHTRLLLEASHQHTYFTIDGLHTITETYTGSRPGDPYGTFLFNLAFACHLKQIKIRFQHAGLTQTVTWSGVWDTTSQGTAVTVETHVDPSFVDDTLFVLIDPEPYGLLQKLQVGLSIINDVFTEAGHKVNYGPCKTAVILMLRGKGSAEAKLDVGVKRANQISFPVGQFDTLIVDSVVIYQHLGAYHDKNLTNTREVANRTGQAFAAVRPLRKGILSNDSFNKHGRIIYCNSHLQL